LKLELDHLRLFPLIPRRRTVQHCRTDGGAAVLRIADIKRVDRSMRDFAHGNDLSPILVHKDPTRYPYLHVWSQLIPEPK
jgi:hypothetical protein